MDETMLLSPLSSHNIHLNALPIEDPIPEDTNLPEPTPVQASPPRGPEPTSPAPNLPIHTIVEVEQTRGPDDNSDAEK